MHKYLGGNDNSFYLNQWLTFSQVWGIGLEHAIIETKMGCQNLE
jgi:hypothetical protein